MKGKLTYEAALDRLNGYIVDHHLRHTPEREMVLEEICHLPQPFTADQLVEACIPLRLSRATIYNTLSLFVVARILYASSREYGRTATEYELMAGAKSRMQMICKKCGRTVEIHDKAIERLVNERKYSNFMPEHYSLYVYGECKVCRRKVKK